MSPQPPSHPWIETPLVESSALSKLAGCRIFLKLENLQPGGSFKARGIGNFILHTVKSSPPGLSHHFYISSGGNAGLAAVTSSSLLGFPCTVVVPMSCKPMMIEKLRLAGAVDVIQHGASWREADNHLREIIRDKPEAQYVPPFDHPQIWKGASTMIDEIERQLGDRDTSGNGSGRIAPDVVICSVGGGGLLAGIAQGLDESTTSSGKSAIIAVETRGAESLYASVQAGKLVTLPGITSIATSLGAVQVCEQAYRVGMQNNTHSIVVSDEQAMSACLRFADDHRTMVEASCGAALAVVYDKLLGGLVDVKLETRVVVVVCGGSIISLDIMEEFRQAVKGQ